MTAEQLTERLDRLHDRLPLLRAIQRRIFNTMKVTTMLGADLLGSIVTGAMICALLCYEMGRAVWGTAILGKSAAEQLEDL